MLPDVPLLAIFHFYVAQTPKAWYSLVHVCRIWRSIVFGHLTESLSWEFQVFCQAGGFVSGTALQVALLSDSHSRGGTSTSFRVNVRTCVGKATSRAADGWNFYILLLP